jgi:hypothetical protein
MHLVSNQAGTPEFKKFILVDRMSLGVDVNGDLWIIGSQINRAEPTFLDIEVGDDLLMIMHKTNMVGGIRSQLGLSENDKIEFDDAQW